MTSLSEAKRQGASPRQDVAPLVPPTDPVLPPENQSDAGGATPLRRFRQKGRWKQAEDGTWRRLSIPETQARTRAASIKRATKHYGRPFTSQEKEHVAVMKASGMTDKAVGRALIRSKDSVGTYAKTPEVQALIDRWRFMFRAQALEQTSGIQLAAWGRVKDSLKRDDPKAFDSYTRGIHAMEKVAASASGENKPVGAQVAILNQVTMTPEEREDLLRAFKADLRAEDAQVTPTTRE